MSEQRRLYQPGQEVADPEPGDFFLTHDDYWSAQVIRVGQRLRYHGELRKYAFWNHAGGFTDREGGMVEAMGQGVRAGNISRYRNRHYAVVRIDATEHDRQQMARFLLAHVGIRYGNLTLVSIGFSLLTGSKLVFTLDGSDICSGLVAAHLTRGDYILDRSPVHYMPADLAKAHDVPGPDSRFWRL